MIDFSSVLSQAVQEGDDKKVVQLVKEALTEGLPARVVSFVGTGQWNGREKLRLLAEPVVATVRKRDFDSLKGRVFRQLHKRQEERCVSFKLALGAWEGGGCNG